MTTPAKCRSNRNRKTAGFRMPGNDLGVTQLPVERWRRDGQYISTDAENNDGHSVAQFFGPKRFENIARVLTCVDAHDALVEALSRALANEGQDACCLPITNNLCNCWRCKARAALAKVRS